MAKKLKTVKCEKCGLEFPESELSKEHENKTFIFDDSIVCKDCLIKLGGDPTVVLSFMDSLHQEKAKPHDW